VDLFKKAECSVFLSRGAKSAEMASGEVRDGPPRAAKWFLTLLFGLRLRDEGEEDY